MDVLGHDVKRPKFPISYFYYKEGDCHGIKTEKEIEFILMGIIKVVEKGKITEDEASKLADEIIEILEGAV